jgi:hypothetical protein
MIRRLAAVSALVLAAFAAAPAAQAQGFLSFGEASPRDVVDGLYEQGYTVRLPMIRRGDVYVVDAVSASRRPMRLIVSARDGHVLQRFVSAPRFGDDQPGAARWRDEEASRTPDDSDDPRWDRRPRTAFADPDDDFDTRPTPPAPLPDDADKAKRHAHKHDVAAKPDATVASTPPDPQLLPGKSVDAPSPKPTPTPTTQAKVEPAPAPKPVMTAVPQAKAEDRPAPRVIPLTKPTPEAKVEDKPAVKTVEAPANADDKPAPKAAKAETPRKKLNDLPVGTLD